MRKRLILRRNLQPKAAPVAPPSPSPAVEMARRIAGEFTHLRPYGTLPVGCEFILNLARVDTPVLVWRKRTTDLAVLDTDLNIRRPMNPAETVCIKASDVPPEVSDEPHFIRRVSTHDGVEVLRYYLRHFAGLSVGDEFCFNTGSMVYRKISGGGTTWGGRRTIWCRPTDMVYLITRESVTS